MGGLELKALRARCLRATSACAYLPEIDLGELREAAAKTAVLRGRRRAGHSTSYWRAERSNDFIERVLDYADSACFQRLWE